MQKNLVNLKYVSKYENESNAVAEFYKSINVEKGSVKDIKEYDYSLYVGRDFGTLYASDSCKKFTINDQKIEVCFQKSKGGLLIFSNGKRDSALVMNIVKLLQT